MSKMKKIITVVLIFLCAASMFLVFSPSAQAQADSLKVLSHSWFTSAYSGNFIVVGELQNNSTDIMSIAKIFGAAFTTDGEFQAESANSRIWAMELLPNQTAPFYMEFDAAHSVGGNLTWVTNVDRIDFRFYLQKSNSTVAKTYQDLQIMGANSYIDASGNYSVTGVVWNKGTGYPGRVYVVSSFYDSAGKVIAVGVGNFLVPEFQAPGATPQFTVTPVFPNVPPSTVTSRIAGYNVQVVSEELSLTEPSASPSSTPAATSSPSTSASPNPTSTGPTASAQPTNSAGDNEESGLPMKYVYAIIAAVVIAIAVIVLAFVVRGRRAKT